MAHVAQKLTQEPIYKSSSIFCFKLILLSAHKLILLIYGDNSLVVMVRTQSFGENCSLLIIPGMTQHTLRWKLFPFSLTREAKIWYNQTARKVGGDWIQLKDEFYLFFYPVSKVVPHRKQLLSFEQGDESLRVA